MNEFLPSISLLPVGSVVNMLKLGIVSVHSLFIFVMKTCAFVNLRQQYAYTVFEQPETY